MKKDVKKIKDAIEVYIGQRKKVGDYYSILRNFAGFTGVSCEFSAIATATETDALKYRQFVMREYASKTAAKYIRILSCLTSALWKAGYLKNDPFALVRVPNSKGKRVRWYRELTIEEVKRMQVAVQEGDIEGLRNGVIFGLLFKHALRISEALGARVEDYEDGVLTIRNTKEGQDFSLQLCEEVRGLVEQLKESVSYERGLLVCSRRYGRVEPETQLCPKGVNSMLKKHAERLGIKEFSSHSGRVTAITNLLRKGYTYEEVRTVSRHSSNAVVEEYDRRTFQKPEVNYGGNGK